MKDYEVVFTYEGLPDSFNQKLCFRAKSDRAAKVGAMNLFGGQKNGTICIYEGCNINPKKICERKLPNGRWSI